MACRGAYLYTGYLPGRGLVRVFQDLDSTKHVFALMTNGQSVYTTREAIQPRKVLRARSEATTQHHTIELTVTDNPTPETLF